MGELGEGLSGYLDVENATLRAPRLEATSNIGIANTAPRHAFSVGSNLYVSTDSSNVLTVNGNVACEGIKMGLIEITPSYDLAAVSNVGNVTSNTLQFSNATTGFVTTSNVEIGGGTIFSGHILPSADNTYDIGSAAFKIRDMYVSDNSLWIGDDTKLSVTEGELKFRKRNTGVVPKGITDMGGTGSAALTHAGVSDINDMKLHHWEAYAKSIDATKTTKDIFTDDVENYETSAIKTFNTSNAMTIGTTKTFVVTVSDASGANKYYIDGIQQPYLTLHQHQTYIFDLSSPTLVDHPFIFSETADGSAYTTGITTTGVYGSTEKRTFIVPAGAPATLYYYCTAHAGMGATVSISSEAELIVSGDVEVASNINASNITTTQKLTIDGLFEVSNTSASTSVDINATKVWFQEAKIQASDKELNDRFGYSVSMNGDGTKVIMGAYYEDTGGTDAGAAYIFAYDGSSWSQEGKIQASDPESNDNFGSSISMSGDGTKVIVGAYYEDTGGTDAGAAYVFTPRPVLVVKGDIAAENVGIGTSEPSAALDVRGNIKCDTYMLNDNRYLTPYFTGNGSLSTPAVSGWHLAQLNNNYNLGLTNGYFWIKSPAMPNPLQMYVNFTADGGGYDFYRYTSATSVNKWHNDNGTRVLGLDLFYPRSKAHWAAIYDFVVNVNGSTISADVPVAGAVYSKSITLPVGATETYTDNYTTEKMRDPRYYGDGVPDWKVPDGGKWWLSDTTMVEPNGDYAFNTFLYCHGVSSAGVVTINDGTSGAYTGTTIICSTNVKGSSIPYF